MRLSSIGFRGPYFQTNSFQSTNRKGTRRFHEVPLQNGRRRGRTLPALMGMSQLQWVVLESGGTHKNHPKVFSFLLIHASPWPMRDRVAKKKEPPIPLNLVLGEFFPFSTVQSCDSHGIKPPTPGAHPKPTLPFSTEIITRLSILSIGPTSTLHYELLTAG